MDVPRLKAESLIDPQVRTDFHIETSIETTTPTHCHDYFEFFIITAGRCVHQINGRQQYLAMGDMVFIRPDDVHSYDFYGDTDCEFVNINFYADEAEDVFHYFENRPFVQYLKTAPLPPCVSLPPEDRAPVLKKSEQIRMFVTIDKQKARILARSFLTDALSYFFLYYHNGDVNQMPGWLDDLLFQMQKKENFIHGLSRLYALSDKSSGHINRSFQKHLNTTPTAYINRLKLGYAKNLIVTTNLGILDIAMESGFDNLSHFYHLFRQAFGVAPGKLRESTG